MTPRITRRQLGFGTAALAASPALAQARDRITVVMSSFDMLFWPTLAAQGLGFFGQQGLEVELVRAGGGARSLAAVAGGDAHFNIGAPASAFRARARGSDVMMIAPAVAQYFDNITMSGDWARRSRITAQSSYEDRLRALKGMTLAVSSVGGGADQLVRFLAKQAGINPDREMTITAIPDGPNMMAAMSRGRIDGFVIPPPTGEDAVRNHGAQPLIWAGRGEVPQLDGFIYIGVIARESWLRRNREVALRFLRTQQRAFEAVRHPEEGVRAREAVWNGWHQRTEKGLFDEVWNNSVPAYPRSIALEPVMIDRIVAFVNETQPEPLDAAQTRSAWTNDYAAEALARRG
jgi:NitT/TauT family transport system substrate-binding protein